MDENQNTNQNSSDNGGIFGSSINFSNPATSQNPTQQNTNQKDGVEVSEEVRNDLSEALNNPLGAASNPAKQELQEKKPVAQVSQADFSADTLNESRKTEEKELQDLGVTVINPQEVRHDTNVFDATSHFNPVNIEKSEIKKQFNDKLETQDLEKDFSETFRSDNLSTIKSPKDNALDQEEQRLKKLHTELKNKAQEKKQFVKEGLERLKKEKESLGRELQEIKEIEEVAAQIYEKIKHIETLDDELDTLEKKAQEELSL